MKFLFFATALLATQSVLGQTGGSVTDRIEAEFNKKNWPAALQLVEKAITAEPKNPQLLFYRGRIYEETGQHKKAISDFDESIRIRPAMPAVYQHLGSEHFKEGQFRESVAAFDKFIELAPDREPYHWQRGISCYYAGEFDKGRQQFELHQTVNPNDVENAVWHFLCVARKDGVDKARAALLPIKDDARVPMMQIYALFAGKGKVESIIAAAREPEAKFYADLYLGLYFEATNDARKAGDYIRRAAKEAPENNYMGDVARVHARLLESSPKK